MEEKCTLGNGFRLEKKLSKMARKETKDILLTFK